MMQPWQEAGEATKRSAVRPFQNMAKAANLLSYALPTGLAVKGLSSLNPTLSKFFNLAANYGFSQDEAVNSLKEKFNEYKQNKKQTLFDKLVGDVDLSALDEGRQKQLGFLAPVAAKLEEKGYDIKSPEVKKLKNKIKKILGGMIGFVDKEAMEMEPQQPMGGQGQMGAQQPGQGQQALMAILQKIQATRGQGG